MSALVRVGTDVPAELAERLREVAAEQDRSIAAVIRRAIVREIENHERSHEIREAA